MWKLFSINKKEPLVDILKQYTEEEVRKAIPKAFKGCHFSKNPPKTKIKIWTTAAGKAILELDEAETGGER